MTSGIIKLSKRECDRLKVLSSAELIGRTNAEIARAMGLSVRQVQRLKRVLREEGPEGLAHGNRGRRPVHSLGSETAARVARLYKEKYEGFNFSHFTEKLVETEGIGVSVSTVRRVLLLAGYRSPKKRRPPKHRSRRERRACEGAMLQLDGSPHDWLQGRGPRMCLLGAIDDATGNVAALFRMREDAHGYFLLIREVLRRRGVPESVYHDHHGIFERDTREEEELWEQYEGKRAPTQFGRLMEELGVQQIAANSPQAKGRVERLWGTFQDRLVSELRFANACTIEEANEVLRGVLADHNHRFCRKPKDPQSVYRKPPKRVDLESLFCFKYIRCVSKDNIVTLADSVIQIPRGTGGRSYAGCRVEVQHRFDGTLHVYYRGERLARTDPPAVCPEVIRVRTSSGRYTQECPWTDIESWKPKEKQSSSEGQQKERKPNKPSANHPWRRTWVTKSLNA